jgi:hypothetical protein
MYLIWVLKTDPKRFSCLLMFVFSRPVLSQVKQNTPIILPGFQSVEVPDELSGQYSVSVFPVE